MKRHVLNVKGKTKDTLPTNQISLLYFKMYFYNAKRISRLVIGTFKLS